MKNSECKNFCLPSKVIYTTIPQIIDIFIINQYILFQMVRSYPKIVFWLQAAAKPVGFVVLHLNITFGYSCFARLAHGPFARFLACLPSRRQAGATNFGIASRRKITTVAFVGPLLFGLGCATYHTLPPNTIKPHSQIDRQREGRLEKSIDYDSLSWQEAIEYVQTPQQAQDYLNRHMHYHKAFGVFVPGIINVSDNRESFKKNHVDKRGICFDYATSAAALLSDDSYPPLLLSLKGESLVTLHAIFLYRTPAGFGALGNTPMEARYSSVDTLVKDFKKKYGISFKQYSIVDLDKTFKDRKWIDGDKKLINGSLMSHYVEVK